VKSKNEYCNIENLMQIDSNDWEVRWGMILILR